MANHARDMPIVAGDLLYGPKAIAAFLGVPTGIARHLVRAGLIPTFALGDMVCARRSTLAIHFTVLETEARRRRDTTASAKSLRTIE